MIEDQRNIWGFDAGYETAPAAFRSAPQASCRWRLRNMFIVLPRASLRGLVTEARHFIKLMQAEAVYAWMGVRLSINSKDLRIYPLYTNEI